MITERFLDRDEKQKIEIIGRESRRQRTTSTMVAALYDGHISSICVSCFFS